MKKFFLVLIVLINFLYSAIIDEPNLDVLFPTPKTYSFVSDGTNITITASKGANNTLHIRRDESFFSTDFNMTINATFNYVMTWTGLGYEGVATKTNWTLLDTYYEGVRVILTFDKLKEYVYLDLYNKEIKTKIHSLYKTVIVGYETNYIRDLNDTETEISSSSYNSSLLSFDTTFNSLSLVTSSLVPVSVKNQMFDDLLYNYSPTASAGIDQIVSFGSFVTLDASSSIDLDGTITSYLWKEGNNVLSTASSFSKSNFSLGTHTLTVTVTDNDGATSTDTVIIVVSILDSDNDTIPDDYEMQNGLNPNINDANDDLDNDGVSNLQEYQDGTKANDANSRVFTLSLNQDWNLVSFPLNASVQINMLNNTNIKTIRSLQNGIWKVWTKENSSSLEQTLSSLDDGYGYWIQTSNATSLDIKGDGVPDIKTIQENQWNMMGSQTIKDINTYFVNNPSVKVIWKFNNNKWYAVSSHNDISDELNSKDEIGTIQSITSNEGFLIK